MSFIHYIAALEEKRRVDLSTPTLLFQALNTTPSVANLPADLTINGTTVSPTLRYKGADYNGTTWAADGYGETLALAGAGAAPTPNAGSPLFGSDDYSVLFPGAKYLTDSGTSLGDVTTSDVVIEGVARATGTTSVIAAKRDAGVGWEVGIDADDKLYLTIEDSGGSATVVSAALSASDYFYFSVFADRSGHGQIYINASASGAAVDISGVSATLSNAESFSIGADSAGAGLFDDCVTYLALYQGDTWLDTHLQATVAKDRFARLLGMYPSTATGTAVPSVMSRSSSKYIRKYENDGYNHLYPVGNNWPAMEGLIGDVVGYNPEQSEAVVNKNSEDISGWSNYNSTDAQDVGLAPDGSSTINRIVEDDTEENRHGVYQTGISATQGDDFLLSCFAAQPESGGRRYIQLGCEDNVGYSTAGIFVDLQTGTITDTIEWNTAAVSIWDYGCEPVQYDGLMPAWRCWVRVHLGHATATVLIPELWLSDQGTKDGNKWPYYDGDSSTYSGGVLVWGYNMSKNGHKGPTSYVKTTTASVTRAADNLRYVATGNVSAGAATVKCNILVEETSPTNNYLWHISDGGAATDSISCYLDGATGVVKVASAASGGSAGSVTGTTDVCDGTEHTISVTWAANSLSLKVDDVAEGTPDTTVTIPDDLDRVDVGMDVDGANQLDGLISNLRIYE